MEKLQCELCNGTDFTKNDEYFVCDFCRAKYSTEQAKKMMIEGIVEVAGTVQVDRGNETANLITLAESALAGGNATNAFDYANRALEIDVDNWQAWAIKGKAAGWSSTLNNFRMAEMLTSFNTALVSAPEGERSALKIEWAGEMLKISVAVHNLSWKHVNKFPGVKGSWLQHSERCVLILGVLDLAYQWGGQQAILENSIMIASNLIIGIKFKNVRGRSAVIYLQPAFENRMQQRINTAGEEMRKFDPAYVAPKPKRQKVGLF